MSVQVIEGTWEEIKRHEAELRGRQLRVTIQPTKDETSDPNALTTKTASAAHLSRVSAMGKYAGILSSEDFMQQKQEEIDLEERSNP